MIWNTEKFNKLLKMLKAFRSENTLHPFSKAKVKQHLISALTDEPALRMQKKVTHNRKSKLIWYLASSLCGLSLISGTAFASNNAQPGNLLYKVKLAKEKIELTFASTIQAKAHLQARFAEERLAEYKKIMANENKALKQETKVKSKALEESIKQTSQALDNLDHLKASLETQGHGLEASSVNETIIHLKASFGKDNEDGNQNVNGFGQSSDKSDKNNDDSGLKKDRQKLKIDITGISTSSPTFLKESINPATSLSAQLKALQGSRKKNKFQIKQPVQQQNN